mmetsp:Transcript_15240/g.27082  ORF Transcript_15240/g.27082 Transcript_15240/m.27082 type:complete len:638 (-) Transcript_15240:37-1950(-)
MAETELVENEVPETQTGNAEYDESLLIIVKGQPVQPQMPDFTESRKFQSMVREEAKKHIDRNQEIMAILKDLKSEQVDNKSGNQDASSKLQSLRNQKETLQARSKANSERQSSLTTQRAALRASGINLIRSVPGAAALFRSSAGVNLPSTSSLDAVFRTLAAASASGDSQSSSQIEGLHPLRDIVNQISDVEFRISGCDSNKKQIQSELKVLEEEIINVSGHLDVGRDYTDSIYAQIRKLQSEQRDNSDVINCLHKEVDAVRKVDDAAYDEYIKKDRAFRAWKRAEIQKEAEAKKRAARARSNEKRENDDDNEDNDEEIEEEEKKENGDEGKGVAEEGGDLKVNPKIARRIAAAKESFEEELKQCAYLTNYFKRLTSIQSPAAIAEKAAAEKAAAEKATAEKAAAAGFKPFICKKKNATESLLFGGKPVGGNKKSTRVASASSSTSSGPVKIQLSVELISAFAKVGVVIPWTTEQVPSTLKALEQATEGFLKKREEKVMEASSTKKTVSEGEGGKGKGKRKGQKEEEETTQVKEDAKEEKVEEQVDEEVVEKGEKEEEKEEEEESQAREDEKGNNKQVLSKKEKKQKEVEAIRQKYLALLKGGGDGGEESEEEEEEEESTGRLEVVWWHWIWIPTLF